MPAVPGPSNCHGVWWALRTLHPLLHASHATHLARVHTAVPPASPQQFCQPTLHQSGLALDSLIPSLLLLPSLSSEYSAELACIPAAVTARMG